MADHADRYVYAIEMRDRRTGYRYTNDGKAVVT